MGVIGLLQRGLASGMLTTVLCLAFWAWSVWPPHSISLVVGASILCGVVVSAVAGCAVSARRRPFLPFGLAGMLVNTVAPVALYLFSAAGMSE